MSEKAIKAEAAGDKTTTVKWRDLAFDFPSDASEWPFEAGLALEEGKYLIALRELLSREQFNAFVERKPKGKDAGDIMVDVVKSLGARDVGESSASSD